VEGFAKQIRQTIPDWSQNREDVLIVSFGCVKNSPYQ
jgi:hypothetical protein